MISRRGFLLAAGALALAGCASGASVPTPSASPTGSLEERLAEVVRTIANGNELVGVALRDLTSGNSYGANPGYASQSASMAKPMIVAMALRKARADGGELSADRLEDCRKAITESDNDAADRLWAYAGTSSAYDALAAELGMANTHSDPGKDWWSWTWTTPEDQLVLLNQLLHPDTGALTAAESAQILALMGQVIDDQAWGVGAVRSADTEVALKNGWVQFESTDKLWAVNSIGYVDHPADPARKYLLAIMTRYPDFPTGRETCTAIGTWVYDLLGNP
jgi:beta-lactamase class A